MELRKDLSMSLELGKDPSLLELDKDPSMSEELEKDPSMSWEFRKDPSLSWELGKDSSLSWEFEKDPSMSWELGERPIDIRICILVYNISTDGQSVSSHQRDLPGSYELTPTVLSIDFSYKCHDYKKRQQTT